MPETGWDDQVTDPRVLGRMLLRPPVAWMHTLAVLRLRYPSECNSQTIEAVVNYFSMLDSNNFRDQVHLPATVHRAHMVNASEQLERAKAQWFLGFAWEREVRHIATGSEARSSAAARAGGSG